jgi:hypothetical protein
MCFHVSFSEERCKIPINYKAKFRVVEVKKFNKLQKKLQHGIIKPDLSTKMSPLSQNCFVILVATTL